MKAQHISLDQVEQSIAQLVRIHPTHVTTDKIKMVHAQMNEPLPQSITPSQQTKDIEEHAKHHLIAYQALLTSRADEPGGVA